MFHQVSVPDTPELTLSGAEGRHAATVRRLRPGERLDVTDGHGVVAECTVVRCRRDELDCAVERRVVHPAQVPLLVVVQALVKGDRGELAVELMTEVGVDEIVPWAASRSIARWEGERGTRAHGRWSVTAREAAKQSRRVCWPRVCALADTDTVAARLAAAEVAVVLHEDATEPLTRVLAAEASATRPSLARAPDTPAALPEIVVVVGPEGGITTAELEVFAAAGGRPSRLGRTVLRTSTAGVVAAAVVLSHTSRWDR
ncbi:16S rRNA (uracil(1498)-N(3))-methyltransferase [Protofrankia symbiont of Coriaria ruscifolia]|uniref:16S rRNA (uracil(1498)-N(3))-methyltransferase n=1 Tax=Protofrankia symbiont of Coriaria ruscifolia TaxID=1306542 RepID=UPI0010415078|nr:16S rRNA (uracil(1498)-N(3))-methyltransferase [Protofrankia symbiont of Coriaria ruscifolia]